MKDNQKNRGEKGFTLIELVISIVILGILSVFTYGIIALNARTFNSVRDNTIAYWDVRRAMHIMRHDIQEIRPQNLMTEANGQFSATRLRFTDLNGNLIIYRRNGEMIQRKVNQQAWMTLLTDVIQDPFGFLDINSSSTNNKNNLVFIQVSLRAEKNNKTVTLEDKFYARN